MRRLNNKSNFLISRYQEKDQPEWDAFIDQSKNGTFLHKINYLHHHKNRFTDCSFLIKNQNQIVALIPGNIDNQIFYSHSGITYGGLIIRNETKVEDVLTYFNMINEVLKNQNVKKVIYKAIPPMYCAVPAQEDEYVLFRLGAKLVSCGISSAIRLDKKLPFSSIRKRKIKNAQKHQLGIRIDYSYQDFWEILNNNLKTSHNLKPVHNLSEIINLKSLFPQNIQLFSVYQREECIAGAVLYITKNVTHVQYISANECGKQLGALDFLFDYLINDIFSESKYFDFGTSVENHGHYLNEGLIFQKQGFGARAVLYQQFEYDVNTPIQNVKENENDLLL